MIRQSDRKRSEIRTYVTGYVLALLLSAAAFAAVRWQHATPTSAFAVVLALALAQMVVHFRYFLHISLQRSARDDLQLVLFSAVIAGLMVAGTLVILFDLKARMS
ncbi:cytochrome o ubiquinol oxidase subunit IV [Solimonas marina]|uniref:Cytochrome bo(3) ubiquinol oxidase subunit 4 n=1 Tax=Solimonas marina TaxID=2714601 RepID=A0A969WBN3_9GAMM|nr:cytochrome C oxidase subunit IV family protein [Solimonas marina]NKF24401.1 cytochrome-c oxidase [Solimonas marina]